MDEIIVSRTTDIKNLILTIRGTQALLDSDVARLYGYETKVINQSASRNIARFPEHFRFQLTNEEIAEISLRSQIATLKPEQNGEPEYLSALRSQNVTLKPGQHRKYRPYAYTEQGIAMLSGLLKNETAVKVSIGIMDAFVEMRRFISAYGKAFERITEVEHKLIGHDKKFDELFDLIQAPHNFKQGIFFKGQIYDAFKLITDIFHTAKTSITVVDNYADDSVLDMLAAKKKDVFVTVVTSSPKRISELRLAKFNEQYPSVEIVKSDEFHDRFIIIDDTGLYHVGASLKDAGKKIFALSAFEDVDAVVSKVKQILEDT